MHFRGWRFVRYARTAIRQRRTQPNGRAQFDARCRASGVSRAQLHVCVAPTLRALRQSPAAAAR